MTKPRKHETLDLQVSNLAYGGKGIARREGFVFFVAGAVPGDVVRATVTKVKKNYAEARLEEILEPSPERRRPECPHFGSCGGCRWQSLEYSAQLRYKEQQVRESLEKLGGLEGFKLQPIRGMEDPWRYRNKVEFSIGAGEDGKTVIGFHPPGRWDTVLPLTQCLLVPEATEGIRNVVEEWARDSGLAPWDAREERGFLRHLTIREAYSTGEILVSLTTSGSNLPGSAGLVESIRAAHPQTAGILHSVNEGAAGVANHIPYTTLWGRPHIYEELDGLRLKVSIDAFLQTNTRMSSILYGLIAEAADLTGREIVWDLYSGIGSIGLYLTGKAQSVLGIEMVPAAVADSRENAILNGIESAYFLEGNARPVLKQILEGKREVPTGLVRPDVVVLDPPRGGLAKKVVGRVAAAAPARVVYVSCNPTTMASNLRQFAELGYALQRITPVDMFPHTPHIEAVGLLEPKP